MKLWPKKRKKEIKIFHDIAPPAVIARMILAQKKASLWLKSFRLFLKTSKYGSLAILGLIVLGGLIAWAVVPEEQTKNLNIYPTKFQGDIASHSDLGEAGWKNAEKVLGKPEVPADGDIESFSDDNAAVYKSGPHNLILSDFSKTEEIDNSEQYAKGEFLGAKIKFSFATGEKKPSLELQNQEIKLPAENLEESPDFPESASPSILPEEPPLPDFFETAASPVFSPAPSVAPIDSEGGFLPEEPSAESPLLEPTPELMPDNSPEPLPSFVPENNPPFNLPEESLFGEQSEPISAKSRLENLFDSFLGIFSAKAQEEEAGQNKAAENNFVLPVEPFLPDKEEIISAPTSALGADNSDGLSDSVLPDSSGDYLPNIDAKIIVWYSFDEKVWWRIDTLSGHSLSNALNGGYFSYDLPLLENWEDLKNLRVKFEGVVGGETAVVSCLDSVWLEAEYMKPSETEKEIETDGSEIKLISARKDFKRGEEPELKFQYQKKQGFIAAAGEALGIDGCSEKIKITAKIINPKGEDEEVLPEEIIENNSDVSVKLKKGREFKPGLYKLILAVREIDAGGNVSAREATIEQDFTWGVLAINVNKSIYLSGEEAYLQMGVLNNDGHTICNASLKLQITNPKAQTAILSTEDGTIEYSDRCNGNNVTDAPDYFAYYRVGEPGIYEMKLTNLDNGYEITDSFEDREFVPFDVERIGPTRIYPPAEYSVVLKIKVNHDFVGQVVENVPVSFEILNPKSEILNKFEIQDSNDSNEKLIVWQADWKKGENYELRYQFDAPDISPYVYLLGQLQFKSQILNPKFETNSNSLNSNDQDIVFQEARQWQIAADADPNMILFWDGGAAPSGWTIVSDGAGEDFYNGIFPRGSDSHVTGGGAATHTHTATAAANSGTPSGNSAAATGTTGTVSGQSHTHPTTGTASLTSISNLPAYRDLMVIQYNSGIPAVIPSGAIAIFDSVVADQMPNADWDTYSGTQGANYVRGNTTATGTGGSNTHGGAGHIVSGITLTTPSSIIATISGTAANNNTLNTHTHTACYANNTTNTPNTEPPYVNILPGKTNKDTAIPDGMIAMFDGSSFVSGDWTILSNNGGAFYHKFLKSATAYSAGAGSETHSHAAVNCASASFSGNAKGTALNSGGIDDHTHVTAVTINAPSATTLPPYTDVIVAKYIIPVITISGVCFTDAGEGTACADDGLNAVSVAVNGILQAQTDATVDGSWNISGVIQPAANASIIVFINGESTANERATAVTKYNSGGTGNIGGIKLYQRHLTIGSDQNTIVANSDMDDYDYNAGSDPDDADIIYDVDASFNLTVDNLGVYADEKLRILALSTYQPDSVTGRTNTTTDMQIIGTLTANANTFNVAGNWTNSGTFTAGGSAVILNGIAAQAIFGSSTTVFNNLTITNTSAAVSSSVNFDVAGTMNMDGANTLFTPDAAAAINSAAAQGTLTGAGAVHVTKVSGINDFANQYKFTAKTLTNLTVDFIGATTGQQVDALAYGNLKVRPAADSITAKFASGTVTVGGNLTIGNGANTSVAEVTSNDPNISVTGNVTVAANATLANSDLPVATLNIDGDLTINSGAPASGSFTAPAGATAASFTLAGNFTNNGVFTHSSGAITFDGTAAQTITSGSSSFNNITFNNSSGDSPNINYTGALSIGGNMTLSNTASIASTDNTNFSVIGTINSADAADRALTLASGSADVSVSGAIGAAFDLASLTINGNDITVANIGGGSAGVAGTTVITGDATGTITLTGATYNTAGAQSYNAGGPARAITLNDVAVFTTTDDAINFTGLVNSQVGENNAVTLNAGTAQVIFNNNVGSAQSIGVLTKQGSGDLAITASNTLTCMGLNLSDGTINIAGSSSGAWTSTGNVTISSGTLKSTTSALTVGGSWTNSGSGDFIHNSGTVIFNDTVGGKTISDGGDAFYNITFDGSGGSWLYQDGADGINQTTVEDGVATYLNTKRGAAVAVNGGTLNIDWYLGDKVVNALTLAPIQTGSADITISENSSPSEETVWKWSGGGGGGWGGALASQATGADSGGIIPQPGVDGAIRIREYSKTLAAAAYYKYNLYIAWQVNYGEYDYFQGYDDKYLISCDYGGAGCSNAGDADDAIGDNWKRTVPSAQNDPAQALDAPPTNGTWYNGMIIGLDFTISSLPGGISFVPIDPGASPSNEVDTINIKTSASKGYVVYAWSDGAMTCDDAGQCGAGTTILDWGGSNGVPTSWATGAGFGYSTNDYDLFTGGPPNNRFSGPNYAGFVHNGPGDPVADRDCPTKGAEGDNTITYRLAASSVQRAGPYKTTVIFVVVAQY